MAMASSKAESSTRETKELEEMMKQLAIREEGLDDLIYEDELPKATETQRWLAIGRVHTTKEYGDFGFSGTCGALGI